MTAFRKVPVDMRERMAQFTDGKTRLIGGSADTLYIPGHHREKFLDVLGLFLETECFLEIATPTTVHLVVPPNEPILFVDHVGHLTYSLISYTDRFSAVVDMAASIQRHICKTEMGYGL